MPLFEEVRQGMDLAEVPPVLMSDERTQNAFACLRHVIITKGIYDSLGDEQLAGVIAHELHHWAKADTVGLRFVFATAWPLILVFNFATWLQRWKHGMAMFIGWLIGWPAMVLVRFSSSRWCGGTRACRSTSATLRRSARGTVTRSTRR